MKTCFIALLALGITGFLPRALSGQSNAPSNDLGMSSFPVGTYASCAQGAHHQSGNNFLNASGFQDGAVLNLVQNGSTVASSYSDENGVTQSLSFAVTTGTTATLSQKGQVIPGFTSLCVLGPGNETRYPASMTVSAGTLSYSAGTVFLTLTGGLQSDAGRCGALSQPATFWVLCEDRRGGALPSIKTGPPPVTQLRPGQYSCSTQVETFARMNGVNHYVAGGASGTLTLMTDGTKVTARYNGDDSLAGTLRFGAATPTTAIVEAGQTLMTPCVVPSGRGLPSRTPEPFHVATGALTLTDSTLFLSFAGTTVAGSSCPGAKVAGSLICAR